MQLSIDGLVSGLDTTSIINQILSLERRPIQLISNQAESARQKQTAFLDLSARLLNLQISAGSLSNPSTFQKVGVTSSNPDALLASAAAGVPPGTYSFRVAQLARGSQFVSGGFANANEQAVGAGTLSLELGGGFVDSGTDLDVLNGGQGVSRGSIRVTDADGNSAVVDLSAAITVDDVIETINNTAGIQVTASIAGNTHSNTGRALVLEDDSGGAGTLEVEELSNGTTATDLGIAGIAAGTTLEGTAIQRIEMSSLLSSLGDGVGLRDNGSAADDIDFTLSDGSTFGIDVDALSSVQDLADAIASASGGNATLSVNATGDGFDVVDTAGGGGALVIADSANSTAATDLGVVGSFGGGTATGSQVLSGLNDTLLRTLNGGTGVTAGSIVIQDRAGAFDTVDLSAAQSLQDVIRAINDSSASVEASTNPEGNGLLIRDTSGGGGDLEISESGGGTTAAELGLLSGPVSASEFNGSDLNPIYIHQNTLLRNLNGGRGVADGSIRITDSDGVSFTVNLAGESTLGDVIRDIEGAASVVGSSVDVSINPEGNGLLLQSSSGTAAMSVEEVGGGTTAADLHILGTAEPGTPTQINGAFEETITIGADDTLEDVQESINALGLDVSVSVVNDGSGQSPFRLSVVSNRAGSRSRLLLDSSGTNLSFQQTARAQDGVVFFGESGPGTQPILLRSSSNTYSDVVEGLTITAQEAGGNTVRATVSRDTTAVTDEVADLIDRFNEVLSVIDDLTAFDEETATRGILVGDGTIRNLKDSILRGLVRPLTETGNRYTLSAQVGIRQSNDRLSFDRSEFEDALREDPAAVEQLFTALRTLSDTTALEDFDNGNGVDVSTSGPEFKIRLRDATEVDVDLTGSSTLADVLSAINTAGAGVVEASLSPVNNSIVLTDLTTGSETFRVTALNGSGAFNDLGLNKSADVAGGGTLTGFEVDLSGDVGLGARLSDAIERLVNTDDGVIQTRSDGFDTILEVLEDRITAAEERIVRRESQLRLQFAQLEQAMQESQSTLARLTASLGGLGG